MRTLISTVTTILNCKIKAKNNEAFTEALIKTLNKILDESHMILDNLSDETEVNQKIIFSSKNMIIAEKIIFVLIAIIQII